MKSSGNFRTCACIAAACRAFLAASAAIFSFGAAATDNLSGAHVHGTGRLNIAIEGTTVEIELESPASNIVGFEHLPATNEDRAAVEKATRRLSSSSQLFSFPAEARCVPTLESADSTQAADRRSEIDRKAGGQGSGEPAHAEFRARYRFRCGKPGALTHIVVNLFRDFPGTRKLEVWMISAKGQTRRMLTPDASRLHL